MGNLAASNLSTPAQANGSDNTISQQLCKEIIRMRLGQRGDASRPLGWRKIAAKLGISIETVRSARKSHYYFHYLLDICNNIGIVRMQATAAKMNKPLDEMMDKCFGLPAYLTDALIGVVDDNPLDPRKEDDKYPTEDEVEYLAQESDKLVVVHDKENPGGFGLVTTIGLSRRHIKWLLDQGYEYRTHRMVFRAASMTRSVSARSRLKKHE